MDSATPARLRRVSLAGLLAGDLSVVNELLSACQEVGFFYLDFQNPSTCGILDDVDNIAALGTSVFQLPQEEKQEFSTEKFGPSKILGYKKAGLSSSPFAGKRDGFESFMVRDNAQIRDGGGMSIAVLTPSQVANVSLFGQDDTLPLVVPTPLKENVHLLERFVTQVHEYAMCILSSLSDALRLSTNLKEKHRMDQPSTTSLGMLQYLSYGSSDDDIGHIAHTDIGTLAMVFSQTGGLQVLPPGTEEWRFIEPLPGHAIVNVGDSLSFLTNGALCSCLHRVVPPPDAVGQTKFSVVYLLRPEFDVVFKAHGKEWKSQDWHNQKFSILRAAHLDRQHGAIQTGRQGYNGLVQPDEESASV
ncbi:hypothetical protein CNMCM8927_000882 [Aspergillus lentulus]|uniref:Fe2OG dioxygenase domain-containing protein n=1 Tax=Aspergillus lentulus TaxID=293939 RepID=A0AAN5YJ54_ASPLE|nr:hypothetical protein CNMCM8927_000882 [Aspergillus lentulus]